MASGKEYSPDISIGSAGSGSSGNQSYNPYPQYVSESKVTALVASVVAGFAGAKTLAQLTDVDLTNASVGKSLTLDTDSKWKPISKATTTDVTTAVAAAKSKVRGPWSPSELVWSDDFSQGLRSMWTASNVTVSAIGGGSSRPNYINNASGGGTLTLNVSAVSELAGKTLSQVKFWHSIYRYIGGANLLLEGGVQRWSRSTGADSTSVWEQETVALSNNGNLTWDANGSTIFITGIELYVTASPYMIGDIVTYAGATWTSTTNNNGGVPGVAASWSAIPTAAYTTATRPSAASVGVGASYYDTTLGLPLWSNGSVWKDSTGTTR